MKMIQKCMLSVLLFSVLASASFVLAQEESYEEKLKKHREDSLRIIAKNKQKALEKDLIDKQNTVRIAYNEGLKLMRVRQDERAIQSLKKATNVDIDGVDDTKAKAFYLQAFCEKRLRRYNDAIASYQNAIEVNSNYTEAHHGLAKTLSQIGKTDDAIQAFNQAIASNANYDKSHYELGKIFLEKKKNFAKAVESFRNATEANPKHDKAFTAMGTAFLEQGKTKDAITALEAAVAVNRKNYLAHYHLSRAFNQSGNPTKALESAKRALQARSNYAPAAFEAGTALKHLKRYTDAIQYFTQASKDRTWRKNAQYEID
ncbi:MAG: tetratricopeptide repeat protein, partial [bacterium]